jgi:hypothetical protein
MIQIGDQIAEIAEIDIGSQVAMSASVGSVLKECHDKGIPASVMAFNIAKISDEER